MFKTWPMIYQFWCTVVNICTKFNYFYHDLLRAEYIYCYHWLWSWPCGQTWLMDYKGHSVQSMYKPSNLKLFLKKIQWILLYLQLYNHYDNHLLNQVEANEILKEFISKEQKTDEQFFLFLKNKCLRRWLLLCFYYYSNDWWREPLSSQGEKKRI